MSPQKSSCTLIEAGNELNLSINVTVDYPSIFARLVGRARQLSLCSSVSVAQLVTARQLDSVAQLVRARQLSSVAQLVRAQQLSLCSSVG
jgi:hypothetical protein